MNYLSITKPVFIAVALFAVSWQVAQLVWLTVPVEQSRMEHVSYSQVSQAKKLKAEPVILKDISALNLFGKTVHVEDKNVAQQLNQQQEQIDAPETSLNLKLRGVRKGNGVIVSSAIIEAQRNKQAIYYEGDQLEGHEQVTVHQIDAQRLILKRAGSKYETLTLFDVLQQSQQTSTTAGKIIDKTANKQLGKSLAVISQRLQSNPLSLLGLLKAEPFRSKGNFVGFRVSPGKDTFLFNQLGLREGDIVYKVNGNALDNPDNVIGLLEQFESGKVIEVSLLRNSSPLTFIYRIH